MIKLEESKVNQSVIFLKCIEGVEDLSQKTLLSTLTKNVQALSDNYQIKATNSELYQFQKNEIINGLNIKVHFNSLYKEQMSVESGSARNFYNYIKSRANLCANCYHQKPTTLDHYLPKAKYPLFSVTPANLIPCCRDCNTHKGQYETSKYEEQLIHVYFDNDRFFNEIWLKADINIGEDNVPFVTYDVEAPSTWADSDKKRILEHFKRFKLNELYSAQANTELFSNQNVFKEYINSEDGLKLNLERIAKSLSSITPNTWRASLFRSLAKSSWFCDTGVHNIKSQIVSTTQYPDIILDA